MKLGVRSAIADEITDVKFLVNRFRGYGVLALTHLLTHSMERLTGGGS